MKKLLAILSILAFILVAVPVQADWVHDLPLSGIPEDVAYLSIKTIDKNVIIVTLETKDVACTEYKVVKGEITKTRKCGGTDWKDFVKKNK